MLEIKVRDFQAIKNADIVVEGITVIVGANDVGKTAMSRAICSTLLNQSNDDMIRWGQSEFEVSINIDDDSIVYSRSKNRVGSGVRVSYNGNSKTKVGREKLTDLFPDFPFQIKDVMGKVFFPHHVFQFELPVFSQVDVYEFFSSMFEKIDLMTQLSVKQKKLLFDSRKAVEGKVSVLESWKLSLVEVKDSLKVFDVPAVVECAKQYREVSSIQTQLDIDVADYDILSGQVEYLSNIDMVLGTVDLDLFFKSYGLIVDSIIVQDIGRALDRDIDLAVSRKDLLAKSVGVYKQVLEYQDVLDLIGKAEALNQSIEDNAGRQIKLVGSMVGIKSQLVLAEAGVLINNALDYFTAVEYIDGFIAKTVVVRDECRVKLDSIGVCPLCGRSGVCSSCGGRLDGDRK